MLRAVVPLVRSHFAFVHKHIALSLRHAVGAHQVLGLRAGSVPSLAAVVRPLDDLSEPAAGLRGIDPVRIRRRTLEMIHFPAREVRAADFPRAALAIRAEDERALFRADQYPDLAHD